MSWDVDMVRIDRTIVIVSLFVALAACGSSPPVHYYTLDPMDSDYRRDDENSRVLGFGPLRVPEYLSRDRIVTRGANSEILVDDFSRWAEPLEDAFHRIAAANLDALLDGVVVSAFPYSQIARLDYQVIGRIDRFDTDEAGNVVLLVQWGVLTLDSDIVVFPRRVRYETRASDPHDYGAVSRAMSDAIAALSRDIAREFEAVAP